MDFSEKQQQVTKDCIASTDEDYWLIGSQGNKLRPSNWPERIASTFLELAEFSAKKKLVSECVSQTVVNGRSCLKVRKVFQQGCNSGWGYIQHFALSNKLTIVDNQGNEFQIEELAHPSCLELDKLEVSPE